MNTPAVLLAAVVVVTTIIAYMWWKSLWTPFSFAAGQLPTWAPPKGKSLADLRFSDCVFKVSRADGLVAQKDVTPVLQNMALAYSDAAPNQALPSALSLDAPLNSFSFVIMGFNDAASAGNPSALPWCTAPPTGTSGVCPGSTVTLTGKYRVA
jgi:hypothetical protein